MTPANSQNQPSARYWRRVLVATLALLLVWGTVSFLGPWFARDIQGWAVAGVSIGFWWASQGALIVYVAVIALYAVWMDRLDEQARRDTNNG